MPWIIGIDEAGYGPNLGPFVMTAAACHVPPRLAGADLWDVLCTAVRRASEPADARLLIADSKLVYSPTRGLFALEMGVLASLAPILPSPPLTLKDWLDHLCCVPETDLQGEVWYAGDSQLPLLTPSENIAVAAHQFQNDCRRQRVKLPLVQSVVVSAPVFNRLTVKCGSKGAVLGYGLGELVRHVRTRAPGHDPLTFFIDKHGGRNCYAAVLQNCLPDCMIVAEQESPARSSYKALGLEREIRFLIEPRADLQHFCVALASMVSKYLREVLMGEFNRFWRSHIPELKPTAGYPTDSVRFLSAIRPTMERLGVAEPTIWRCK